MRYIKLGEGGTWAQDCIDKGVSKFGFGTAEPTRFALCSQGRWEDLYTSLLPEAKNKGVARDITGQAQAYFEDDGTTLWITFHAGKLYWGMAARAKPKPSAELDGVIRKMHRGWSSSDITGQPLKKDALAGKLTKVEGYRGTSCAVTDARDYVIHRINGEKMQEVADALRATAELQTATLQLLRHLDPKDFELLVELVFTTSGWRRVGRVGGAQPTIDFHLTLPSTEEHAFVQVKSRTTLEELGDYTKRFSEQRDVFDRMFFVYHSGTVALPAATDGVTVIGPEKLARMVLEAGLVQWLIDKTS